MHLLSTANGCRILGLLFLLLALAPAQAQAQDNEAGKAAFVEGNEMARNGVYRTALLRYRQAEDLGFHSPLVDYNRGVVHYRLEQYQRAEQALRKAARAKPLAPRAWYNLGLAHRAQGNTAAARRWFEQAQAASNNKNLNRLVDRALADLRRQSQVKRAATTPIPRRDRREPPGKFNFTALLGIGQDDNVYRSADSAYVDIGDPTQPAVSPAKQSGTFVPVDLDAEYLMHNEAGDTDFVFTYRMAGDFYTDTQLDNANEISQRFSIAAKMFLGDPALKTRRLYAAFVVRDHVESNFDPDDGLDRTFNGIDVSDRFSYRSAGINARFQQKLARWELGLDLRFERRDYDNTDNVVPNFDHEYESLAPWLRLRLSEKTVLTGRFEYYRRNYDERPSRDLNGLLLTTNPATEYNYQAYELEINHRFSRRFKLSGEYRHVTRDDQFVGYYNYDYDQIKLAAEFNPRGRYKGKLAVLARTQDYPNAFAFNTPAGGPRDLDILAVTAVNEIRLLRSWSLSLEVRYRDFTSSDPRNQYSRLQTMLGVKWNLR